MRLNEFLGIKYPIIQGGMANIALWRVCSRCQQCRWTGTDRIRRFDASVSVRRSRSAVL